MSDVNELIIIGAGPFGLSMAAYCVHEKIQYQIIGKHMDFWKNSMPAGMYLRSGFDWHLDPFDEHTFLNYLDKNGYKPADYSPVPLNIYVDYASWFSNEKGIDALNSLVVRLDHDYENGLFSVWLESGKKLFSKNILVATGFKDFRNVPGEIRSILPEGRFTHTCDIKDFDFLRGKRCLIIGGRMSAFESAALMSEAGTNEVFISYRHETPEFVESDWSWVMPMLDRFVSEPRWFKELNSEERDLINARFYGEGRLKLEPWLKQRLDKGPITFLPVTEISKCRINEDESLAISLNNGKILTVDHVVLATGYKVDIEKVLFLKNGNVLDGIKKENGYPCLDENLQTSIPGLFITSMAATRDFGSFFGFTVSVNTSSRIVGKYLKNIRQAA